MKQLLLLTVFLTGAAALILEIVGVRLLSPYFGNTLFTVSSVISVFLAALSLGYYLGGLVSEKRPELKFFYQIITMSGVVVLVSLVLSKWFLTHFFVVLPMTAGPLVASLVTFLLPGVLLGMLSPLAVKLGQTLSPKEGVGKIAGEIFFWSTAGSILGSLMTGFVLIPHFGISNIFSFTGCGLIILGGVPVLVLTPGKKKFIVLGIAVILMPWLMWQATKNKKNPAVVWQEDGVYERLSVLDSQLNGRPVRYFFQDRSWSGAMYLNSDELLFDYTKYFNLYKAINQHVTKAMVIGGGIYTIPKAIRAQNPSAQIVVAELEPGLEDLARQYFKLDKDPGVTTVIEDGRRLLAKSQNKFDYIFSDVYYSYYSIPAHFTTREFYTLAKDKLTPGGVFIANIVGSLSKTQPSLVAAQVKTFRQVFPNSFFWATTTQEDTAIQGIIIMGINGNTVPDWKKVEGLDPSKLIDIDRLNLEDVPVFTDDFAPTDFYSSKLFVISSLHRAGLEMMGTIKDLLAQGPRYLSSPTKARTQKYIVANLKVFTNDVIIQDWEQPLRSGKVVAMANIIARFRPQKTERLIIATHYDSQRYARLDRSRPESPVPGANNSGSGTAVLLEAARVLGQDSEVIGDLGIDLVFFDGEEGEETATLESWKPLGSEYFADHLTDLYGQTKPLGGVVLDMVGDKDLLLKPESSSVGFAREEVGKFWQIGKEKYPANFSDQMQSEIRDDHTSLSWVGIPSFLVIDFDYPYFFTTQDTRDKCSPRSLEIVLDTLMTYLKQK